MFIIDVVINLQLSLIEKALLEIPSASVIAFMYRLFEELQKPSAVNTIRKHSPTITHL